MKKHFLLFSLLFSLIQAFSQNFSLKLFVEDAVGRKDSVIFGVNDSSSLGMDSIFGELNIYQKPFDSLDIRVIQRDSVNFNCLSYYDKIYFPQNIDSKIDIRPLLIWGGFGSVYNNFEIIVSATNYPVVVKADFNGINYDYDDYSAINLLNDSCEFLNSQSIYSSFSLDDTLFLLMNNTMNTIVANLQFEVGINEQNSTVQNLTLFPNPAQKSITIELENNSDFFYSIYNLFGKIICTDKKANSHKTELNIEHLPQGIYLLKVLSGNQIFTAKFIKE